MCYNVWVLTGRGVIQCNISLILLKNIKGPPGLMHPSDEWITVNSKYAFTTNVLMRDLKLNSGMFCHRKWWLNIPLILFPRGKFKIPTMLGIESRTIACKSVSLHLYHSRRPFSNMVWFNWWNTLWPFSWIENSS